MDRVIRPLDGDWSAVANPSAKIAEWESETGNILPGDYKKFIIKYNGGRIYPIIFNNKIPRDVDPVEDAATFMDIVFPWEMVEGTWNGERFEGRIPPDMLVVASSPGDIAILMSVDRATLGQIYLWLHSQSHWGAENNDRVWLQEESFTALLESLYENDEKDGYEYWYRPSKKGMERKIEF